MYNFNKTENLIAKEMKKLYNNKEAPSDIKGHNVQWGRRHYEYF